MRLILLYFALSFALHLIWEVAQMPLFESEGTFWSDVVMCLYATATGDMLFMAILYGVVAVAHRRTDWIAHRAYYRHPATWFLPPFVGALLAISFELWAVHAVQRWQYGAMPIVPYLEVGLTPLLQMILIPPAVLMLCRRFAVGD